MSTRRKFECIKDLICKLALLDLPEEVHALRKKVETEFADCINGDTIALHWSVEDVHENAKQMISHLVEDPDGLKTPLSDDDAREILATVERRHDASIGVNWDVLATHTQPVIDRNTAELKQRQAHDYLSGLAKQFAEQYPHAKVSFGYIGNCGIGRNDYDDRSFRFFYVPEAGRPSQSFGGYSTERLPQFAEYMRQKGGIAQFGNILQGVVVTDTDWVCKGDMQLGTGCGKCSRCINQLSQI